MDGLAVAYLLITVLLWSSVTAYGFSTSWWALEVGALSYGWKSDRPDEHGLDSIQVRILTVDGERVVQKTVEEIPDQIPPEEIHVIAEEPITVPNAQVQVVPDSFESRADAKGRAHQWALETLHCDREYILYLDEDTRIQNLTGVPNADFIQFTEKPELIVDKTPRQPPLRDLKAWLTTFDEWPLSRLRAEIEARIVYLCEIFRVGYQLEQFGFHRLAYPLYAWGGGFAIRHELEQEVTWRDSTLTEDTNLIWRAAKMASKTGRLDQLEYKIIDNNFRNQAPARILDMFQQRQRWISGSMSDMHLLPYRYMPLYLTRIVVWGFSPVFVLLVTGIYAAPIEIAGLGAFRVVSVFLLSFLYIYMLAGVVIYREQLGLWAIVCIALTPVAVFLHSVGALLGLICPMDDFKVTPKADPAQKDGSS